MKLEEGKTYLIELGKWGGSYGFIVNEDMFEYLGMERPQDGSKIEVHLKADKKSHGRFLAFWTKKE